MHRAHNNTTTMQYQTNTQNTHRETQINLCTVKWAQCDKPNKNCSSKCAYDCAQLQYTIEHRTLLIIFPLTFILVGNPRVTVDLTIWYKRVTD